jgi:ADP-heptose:LPS heptosyltransferase
MKNQIKKLAKNILPTPVYGLVRITWREVRIYLRSRSGLVARLVRYPKPMSAPWRRNCLDVGRSGALGDVLLCTPALRELKLKNPTNYLRFYTNYPTLVRGLPYIDEILAYDERPKNVINLKYEDAIPPRAHIAKIMGDSLGINVRNVRPNCVIDRGLVEGFRNSWRSLPRPYIVVQRRAGRWTPNKDWPEKYWIELIESLSRQASVIEIGNKTFEQKSVLKNYMDLRDRTSLEELIAVIAAGDILVGPPSGPSHIAAAANIPSVLIIGGYEHPISASYSGSFSLYTALACAPCWLRKPCPYDLKCLRMIRPDAVERAIWSTLAKGKLASANSESG